MTGVAFLPFSCGTYKQMPYEEVRFEEIQELCRQMPAAVDWGRLVEIDRAADSAASAESGSEDCSDDSGEDRVIHGEVRGGRGTVERSGDDRAIHREVSGLPHWGGWRFAMCQSGGDCKVPTWRRCPRCLCASAYGGMGGRWRIGGA